MAQSEIGPNGEISIDHGSRGFLDGLQCAVVACENLLRASMKIIDVEVLVSSKIWNSVDCDDGLVSELLDVRRTLSFVLTDLDENFELLHLYGEKYRALSSSFNASEIEVGVEAYSGFLDTCDLFDLQNLARDAVFDIDFILAKLQKVHGVIFTVVQNELSPHIHLSFFEMHRLTVKSVAIVTGRAPDDSVTEAGADTLSTSEDCPVCHDVGASEVVGCAPSLVVAFAELNAYFTCRVGDFSWCQLGWSRIVFFKKLTPHELLDRWKAKLVRTEPCCLLAGGSDSV
jgi:hypothetical protein